MRGGIPAFVRCSILEKQKKSCTLHGKFRRKGTG
jgi:hypothetical protein